MLVESAAGGNIESDELADGETTGLLARIDWCHIDWHASVDDDRVLFCVHRDDVALNAARAAVDRLDESAAGLGHIYAACFAGDSADQALSNLSCDWGGWNKMEFVVVRERHLDEAGIGGGGCDFSSIYAAGEGGIDDVGWRWGNHARDDRK